MTNYLFRLLGKALLVFAVLFTCFGGALSAQIKPQITTSLLTIDTAPELPMAMVGVSYSSQFAATGPSPMVWSRISGSLPPGLALSSNGALAGTPTTVGSFDFTLRATGGILGETSTQSFHILVLSALSITTPATLPTATLTIPSIIGLTSVGGLAPYSWTITNGLAPPGMTLSPSGVLSGTPIVPGNFTFTAQVSDSFEPKQQVSRNFTLAVNIGVTIATVSLVNGVQNLPYSQQFQATGGTAPLFWVVSSGSVPAGLRLTTGGSLEGIPTTIGPSSFAVSVSDARGNVDTRNFTLAVDPPIPPLSAPDLPISLNPTGLSGIALSLTAPHPSPLSGKLNISFTSKAEVPADDRMTQFSTGSRTVTFTIPANSTAAILPPDLALLAGTVAGTVRLTANIDNGPTDLPVATLEVLPTAPQITNIEAVRVSGGVDVRITGYSPTRRVTSAEFTFDINNGTTAQRVSLTRTVDANFASWFTNPASVSFGGSFSFLQSFVVEGDGAALQTVTVRLTNVQGSSSSAAIPLR